MCLLLSGIFLNGCVSLFGSSGEVVLERSKEEAPAWISQVHGSFIDTGKGLNYVAMESGMKDLPVGIRETQTKAIQDSSTALGLFVKEKVANVAAQRQGKNAVDSSQYVAESSAVVRDFHNRYSRVGDMYFEEIQRDTPSAEGTIEKYYRAWVLVQFPQEQVGKMMDQISVRLRASKNQELRSLGEALAGKTTIRNASH